MSDSQTARLFQHGRSQAICLPREFRFPGDRVRIRQTADGVLLQPMIADVREWFAEMDRCGPANLSIKSRPQAAAPSRRIFE